ncbi:MAG TPA: response regulator [Ignavibacteriales bacterium]|nr:response regulator [Ignavibacteriales bacterium]
MEKKFNILFVDDDERILNSFKRLLRDNENIKYYFSNSAEQALEILKEKAIDIIISDMKMPYMDGSSFLSYVHLHYPGIIRIILSGYSEEEVVVKSFKYAHQFIAKPLSANKINELILQLIKYEKYLSNDAVRNVINSISYLPTIPSLYAEIEKEILSENFSIRNIAEKIAKDISISTKLLQIVNSAYYGVARNIIDPKVAVNLIGIEVVKSVVLMSGLFQKKYKNPRIEKFLEKLWEHSFKVASIAKSLAEIDTKDNKTLDEVFAIGILHDIGILVMLDLNFYIEIIGDMFNIETDLIEKENYTYKTNHSVIGAYLLNLWGFPMKVIDVIENHHTNRITNDIYLDAIILANDLELKKNKVLVIDKIYQRYKDKSKVDNLLTEFGYI